MRTLSMPNALQNLNVDLLNILGEDITIRRLTEGAFIDPNDPTKGRTQVPTDYPTGGFVYDFTADERLDTTIQEGDKKCIIDSKTLSIEPTTGDEFFQGLDPDNDPQFKIVGVLTSTKWSAPDGTMIDEVYILQLRS